MTFRTIQPWGPKKKRKSDPHSGSGVESRKGFLVDVVNLGILIQELDRQVTRPRRLDQSWCDHDCYQPLGKAVTSPQGLLRVYQ